jgi:hypothetical protein
LFDDEHLLDADHVLGLRGQQGRRDGTPRIGKAPRGNRVIAIAWIRSRGPPAR